MKMFLRNQLRQLVDIPIDELLEARYQRFRRLGQFLETADGTAGGPEADGEMPATGRQTISRGRCPESQGQGEPCASVPCRTDAGTIDSRFPIPPQSYSARGLANAKGSFEMSDRPHPNEDIPAADDAPTTGPQSPAPCCCLGGSSGKPGTSVLRDRRHAAGRSARGRRRRGRLLGRDPVVRFVAHRRRNRRPRGPRQAKGPHGHRAGDQARHEHSLPEQGPRPRATREPRRVVPHRLDPPRRHQHHRRPTAVHRQPRPIWPRSS